MPIIWHSLFLVCFRCLRRLLHYITWFCLSLLSNTSKWHCRSFAFNCSHSLFDIVRCFLFCCSNHLNVSVLSWDPRSTQPSTLRGTVKWVPAKGRRCCVAGKVTAAWWKVMAAYRWVDDLSHLQADCLYTGSSSGPNTSVTSVGSLYLYCRGILIVACDIKVVKLNWKVLFSWLLQSTSLVWSLGFTGCLCLPAAADTWNM